MLILCCWKDLCHGTKLNMMWLTNTDDISDSDGNSGRSIVTNLRFGLHLANRLPVSFRLRNCQEVEYFFQYEEIS